MKQNTENNAFLMFIGFCAVVSMAVVIVAAMSAPPLLPSVAFDTAQTSTVDENFGKVNLNTALKEELMTLPGIGEELAERIIAYREQHGSFQTVNELLNVSGIGEKKWEAVRELVCV